MAQGLRKATKKAQYEANVASLDRLGTSKGEFDTDLSVIEDVAGAFIERVKKNIQKANMVVTGKIEDITLQAEDGKVNIYGYPWLIYQDRGVNGSAEKLYDTPHSYTDKMPPPDVFKAWIRRNNIQLRDNEKYAGEPSRHKDIDTEKKVNQAAWAFAKTIFRKGFKPRNVYSKEIPKLVQDLADELGSFSIDQVIQQIDVKPEARQVIVMM